MEYSVVHLAFENAVEYAADVLAAYLGEIGFESFEHSETGLDAYIPTKWFDEEKVRNILVDFPFEDKITYTWQTIEDKNWNEEWEKYFFEPIAIDNECVIHSSFHRNYPKLRYDITIDPKMAFGTGHHATTSLVISEILQMDLSGKRVLDMGCGTAVLAILASLCGAASVTAIDIDDWCAENSLENITLNNVSDIEVRLGGAELLEGLHFDVVLANINRNILLRDMNTYTDCLAQGGQLYMSGFYTQDVPMIQAKASELGMRMDDMKQKNNWAVVKMVKE